METLSTTSDNLRRAWLGIPVTDGEYPWRTKIGSLRFVREVTGISLRDAKDLVESWPEFPPTPYHFRGSMTGSAYREIVDILEGAGRIDLSNALCDARMGTA